MSANKTDYIKKLKSHIDLRIDALNGLLLDRENTFTINNIILHLIGLERVDFSGSAMERHINSLELILADWSIEKDGDLIGYLYQSLQSLSNLKNKGQYFTPTDIVDRIIESTLSGQDNDFPMKVLDPACGSGQFLISAFKKIRKIYLRENGDIINAGKKAASCLYGLDIDETAITIAKWNIAKIAGVTPEDIKIFSADFLNKDDLYLQSFPLRGILFDYVIGNPPWGSSLSAQQKKYYRINYGFAKSGINTFTLFMERSLELLKLQGKLGFLIPEAFLNIKAHLQARYSLLHRTAIEEICQWGEQFKKVFAPSISIIIRNEDNFEHIRSQVIRVMQGSDYEQGTMTMIPQSRFSSTHEYIFNIKYDSKVISLISYISDVDCFYLANNAQFFLGIVTGNNGKFISDMQSPEFPDPIITGKDIIPFKSLHGGRYFKFEPEHLQQVAPEHFYRTPNKVFYKFIGKNLTFALDTAGVFSLNNVNAFIPSASIMAPEALVAVLNSSLMQYYYQNNFFTVKVLRGNLEKLPIKVMDTSSQEQLIRLSRDASGTTEIHSYLRAIESIDDIVFSEYGVTDRTAHGIFDEFSMQGRIKNYESYFTH